MAAISTKGAFSKASTSLDPSTQPPFIPSKRRLKNNPQFTNTLQQSLANGTAEELEGLILPGDMSDELKFLNVSIDKTVIDVR